MLSIDILKEYGADVDSGLARCVNREDLYFRLVKMVPSNSGFSLLKESIAKKDYEQAFQAAHSLKGVCANLSLDPLSKPVSEITELLRNKIETDYEPILAKIELERKRLEKLCLE